MNNKPTNSLRDDIARTMKFWKASDGSYWSASHRIRVDARLDELLTTISRHLPEKNKQIGSEIKDLRWKGYNQAIDEVNKLLTTNKKEKV